MSIVDALRCITDTDLRTDLQMEMFTNETGKFAKKHKEKLHHFDDVEAIQLLDSSELVRRLARREKPFELLK